MKRCILSVVILVLLVVSCIGSLVLLRTQCAWYGHLADQTAQAAASGDWALALVRFDEMQANWEEFHNTTGLFLDGEKLDAIHEHLICLRPLLADAHPETASELESLRRLIDGLYEEEMPYFWHIM